VRFNLAKEVFFLCSNFSKVISLLFRFSHVLAETWTSSFSSSSSLSRRASASSSCRCAFLSFTSSFDLFWRCRARFAIKIFLSSSIFLYCRARFFEDSNGWIPVKRITSWYDRYYIDDFNVTMVCGGRRLARKIFFVLFFFDNSCWRLR